MEENVITNESRYYLQNILPSDDAKDSEFVRVCCDMDAWNHMSLIYQPRPNYLYHCPECNGQFLQKFHPISAYDGVGVYCDGCLKYGEQFDKTDAYFQCNNCQQIEYCSQCLYKLAKKFQKLDTDNIL